MDLLRFPTLHRVLGLTTDQVEIYPDGDLAEITFDGKEVGTIELSESDSLLSVEFIGIEDPKYRNKGIAQMALKKLKIWAQKEGYRGIFADMIWGGSLMAFIGALGKPDNLSDDIREMTVEEALEILPKTQPPKKDGMWEAGNHISGRWDL